MSYNRCSLANEHLRLMSTMIVEQKKMTQSCKGIMQIDLVYSLYLSMVEHEKKNYLESSIICNVLKREYYVDRCFKRYCSIAHTWGRTTHLRFNLTIIVDKFLTCGIHPKSPLAELIVNTKLIIWDDAHIFLKLLIVV